MQLTIEVPDSIAFESRGEEFAFEIAKVAEDKRAEFAALVFMAGICKAGVDAASSAKTYAEENDMTPEAATREMIEKKLAVWYKGDWSARGVGTGDSAEVREAKSMLRVVVKDGDKKAYKNASPDKRDEMVNAAWEALPDKERESYLTTAKARLGLKAKQAAELAALATGVKL